MRHVLYGKPNHRATDEAWCGSLTKLFICFCGLPSPASLACIARGGVQLEVLSVITDEASFDRISKIVDIVVLILKPVPLAVREISQSNV